MNQRLKQVVLKTLSACWRKRLAPRVLAMHGIDPNPRPDGPAFATPEVFREQIRWLQDRGYRFLTFAELVGQALAGGLPARSVCLSFDDGYVNNHTHALPILLEHGVPATFFVASAGVGRAAEGGNVLYRVAVGARMMEPGHLREMAALGMEIGSHTRSHVHVRRELLRSREAAWQEAFGSRRELEELLGAPVVSFAYPGGHRGVFDPATKGLLREAGYRFAGTSLFGAVDGHTDPLEVPRVAIAPEDSLSVFARKVAGQYDFYPLLQRLRPAERLWRDTPCD